MVGHPPELADLVFQVGFELDESAGAGVAVAEHEAIDATGMKRREELSHQPSLGEAHQRGSLELGCVHDSEDVLASLLEGRWLAELIRQPNAALVERGHADVIAEVLERSAEELLLPYQLDVRHERRHDENLRPRSPLLPREPIAVLRQRVADFGRFHRRIVALRPSACSAPRCRCRDILSGSAIGTATRTSCRCAPHSPCTGIARQEAHDRAPVRHGHHNPPSSACCSSGSSLVYTYPSGYRATPIPQE